MLRIFNKKTKDLTDTDLVKRYQETNELSLLGELYERYMGLVYGVCLKYLNDKGASEDAVMSIFEILVEKVKKHEISNFKSWLHVLTKNHCLTILRKQNNKSSLTLIYDSDVMQSSEELHHEDEAEDLAFDENQLGALKICIDKLAGPQKKCIEMFYFENISYKEIAEQTGIELNKVRSYIQNGKRNLKNCIEEQNNTTSKKNSNNLDNPSRAKIT